jgi:DNA polymerase III subunit epsilon
MDNWSAGEVLGFDFETTGVDRFNDVPVSYALVTVVAGEVVSSEAGLIDPGREIPAGATKVHGISTERARAEGMPLREAIGLVTDAVVSASQRGVPLAGMKLDYDLTILDTQSRRFCDAGLAERGWSGPVLDAVVLDRHLDRFRKGSRTLGALCTHYGVDIGNAHDAAADAVASVKVLLALAARYEELRDADLSALHE